MVWRQWLDIHLMAPSLLEQMRTSSWGSPLDGRVLLKGIAQKPLKYMAAVWVVSFKYSSFFLKALPYSLPSDKTWCVTDGILFTILLKWAVNMHRNSIGHERGFHTECSGFAPSLNSHAVGISEIFWRTLQVGTDRFFKIVSWQNVMRMLFFHFFDSPPYGLQFIEI